jgi:uncharacterized repeat protein (TIGR01451 family)
MRTLVRFALALFLAFPLFAQNDDQTIAIIRVADTFAQPVTRVPVGALVSYWLEYDAARPELFADTVIEVDVPGTVTEIFAGNNLECTTTNGPVRCTLPAFNAPRWSLTITVRIDEPGVHTAVARITNSSVPDPNPLNNSAAHTLEAFARPSLVVKAYRSERYFQPGQRGAFAFETGNRSIRDATNVVFTATLPAGGTFVSNESCAIESDALVCRRPLLKGDEYFYVQLDVIAPDRMDGEDVVVHVVVTSDEGDVDPADNELALHIPLVRQLVVSNVADEGGGSLRQAMLDVNAFCPAPKPCAILFRIAAPVPESGWFTIQPRTPLPEIAGAVTIDGTTQTLATGDTNRDGPEVEINGALVTEESGIRLVGDCEQWVRGLAVNGFPGYGIQIRRAETRPCGFAVQSVVENYLGTDPLGRTAKPNQRGLGLFSVAAAASNNLISGNLRSGVYVVGTRFVDLTGNHIGISVQRSPLGNGASGIFLDMPSGAGTIFGNTIANNTHWAIARTSGAELEIVSNEIFDNVLQGIDFDLDLRTPNREHDLGMPNHPVLFSASYDPVRNVTVVRGRLDSEGAAVKTSLAMRRPNPTPPMFSFARLGTRFPSLSSVKSNASKIQ